MYFIYIQEKIFNFFKAIFVVNSAFNRLHKYNKWHVTCFNLQPVAVSVKKKKKNRDKSHILFIFISETMNYY